MAKGIRNVTGEGVSRDELNALIGGMPGNVRQFVENSSREFADATIGAATEAVNVFLAIRDAGLEAIDLSEFGNRPGLLLALEWQRTGAEAARELAQNNEPPQRNMYGLLLGYLLARHGEIQARIDELGSEERFAPVPPAR